MPLEFGDGLAGTGVPDPGRAVCRGGYDARAVRAESRLGDPVHMSLEFRDCLARSSIQTRAALPRPTDRTRVPSRLKTAAPTELPCSRMAMSRGTVPPQHTDSLATERTGRRESAWQPQGSSRTASAPSNSILCRFHRSGFDQEIDTHLSSPGFAPLSLRLLGFGKLLTVRGELELASRLPPD